MCVPSILDMPEIAFWKTCVVKDKQKRSLYRSLGMLPHRSGMEKLLGGCACGSLIHRCGPASRAPYLSRQHFEDVENSCPMVALPSDVARSGKNVKRAYETVFKAMVNVLERSVSEKNQSRRTTARAIAALCVGGMVVARSLADGALADELRDASMAMALKLGKWDTPNRKLKSK